MCFSDKYLEIQEIVELAKKVVVRKKKSFGISISLQTYRFGINLTICDCIPKEHFWLGRL